MILAMVFRHLEAILKFVFLCFFYTNDKSSVFTDQDDRCGNSTTQSQAPEDGYIYIRNMMSV